MISASQLRDCRDLGALQSLLRALGYRVQSRLVDREEWRRAGIDLPEAPLYLLGNAGAVDLYAFANGGFSREWLATILGALRARNPLRRQVFLHLDRESLELIDRGAQGRLRMLRTDLRDPRSPDVDRWNMLELRGSGVPVSEIFDRALDRRQITRAFFRKFRDARSNLAEALASSDSNEDESELRAEALLILSRILFLYFIQEKGWLNGERRFLVDRLRHARAARHRYFTAVLQPLFFGCLNTPLQARSEAARALGRIPYLNGGLFEPSSWERMHRDAAVSNELMAEIIESVFEKFSFSVEEGEDEGVQVDPEMLGRVFESLMESDERRATGSFYTPREIVDTMTRASIRAAIDLDDEPENCTIERSRELLNRLRALRVLDPACGSGAFLLGALREIERLGERLSAIAGEEPESRQRIVERSLHGVDIKPEAVRLCELRLWLALVSRSKADIEEVPPLPNLDRNILQGNSLLSPIDFLGDGRATVYRAWTSALRERGSEIERYRTAPPGEKPALARALRRSDSRLALALLDRAIDADRKEIGIIRSQRTMGGVERRESEDERALRDRIERLEAEQGEVERGRLSFFAYDVHFAQVMQQGGFDLVIGNPPWVRSSRIDPAARLQYAQRYALFRGSGPGFRQSDLALAFFEKSLTLTRPGGVLSLLVPAKLLNAGYALPLREAVTREHELIEVQDWSDEAPRLFEADTFPMTLAVRRGRSRPISSAATAGAVTLFGGGEWSLLDAEIRAIIGRIREAHAPLSEILRRPPMMGVKTGANSRFFPGEVTIEGRRATLSLLGCDVPVEALCRCVRGRDIRPWGVASSHWMLWPPVNGWPRDLDWVERLTSALGCRAEDLRLSFARPEHLGTKVVWKDVSRGLQAAVLPDSVDVEGHRFPLVPNQTAYFIDTADLDEAWVLSAILNSTVFNALALTVAERAKDAHFRYFGTTVGSLPCPRLERGSDVWDVLGRLARRARNGASPQVEIDETMAVLYGISAHEMERLAAFVRERLRLRQ